ncbi:hypothetical protein JST97_11825 [bacterium]|nr:hypothetical protein [bacterium]
MNLDPIAQQTILNAVRQTQSARVAKTEARPEPPPQSGPQETLEQARSEEVAYNPDRQLQNAPADNQAALESASAEVRPQGVPWGI